MEKKRDVTTEKTRELVGKTGAQSGRRALMFHLVSPYTIRRLAERKTVGAIKYGSCQWRRGINDVEYVTDRVNHLWTHLCDFMENGNDRDDNLGAMLWGLDALIEVERLAPEVLKEVIGTCKLYGESASVYHARECERRPELCYEDTEKVENQRTDVDSSNQERR